MNEQSPILSENVVELEPVTSQEVKETSNPPKTTEEEYLKLNDLIKHMEFNIEQNRKQCDNSSLNCYTLLRSTELLAFDIIFSNYLLSDMDPAEIYDFFEHCTKPQPDLSSGDKEEFQKARLHVEYLLSIIEKCTKNISTLDLKQRSIPKRVSEFGIFLQEQKIRFDHQIKRRLEFEAKKENEEKQKQEEENEETDLSGLPPSFTKWLSTELKIGLTPDQESIEIHCLIKSITNRLKCIMELSNSITELEVEQETHHYDESEEKIKEKIENSPYIIGARKNCQYLRNLLAMLLRQKSLFQQLYDSFVHCKNQLSNLTPTAQRSIDEMTLQMEKLHEILNKKQTEVSAIEQELQPFIALFYTQTRLTLIQAPPQQAYQKLEETLNIMIANTSNNSEISSKYQLDKNSLFELKNLRAELCELNIELNKILVQIEEKDRSILEMSIEYSKVEEELLLQDQEAEQLKKYEEGLNEVQQLLRFNEMSDWCRKLSNILEKLDQIAQNQEIITKNVKSQTEVKEMDELVHNKLNEIDKLSEVNYRMNSEIARSKIELEAVKEEKYHAKMELALNDEFVPDCIEHSKNEAALKKHMKMVMCPVCKKNRRNVFLTTCKHPICMECATAANNKCPICSVMFDDSNIRPFFVQ